MFPRCPEGFLVPILDRSQLSGGSDGSKSVFLPPLLLRKVSNTSNGPSHQGGKWFFFHVFYSNIIPSIAAKFLLEVLAVVAVPRPDCDSISQADRFVVC